MPLHERIIITIVGVITLVTNAILLVDESTSTQEADRV